MVHQMTNQILYQENVDLEKVVNNMNVLIEDSEFLNQLTEVALQKRTRLQVMDLINVLTKEEIEQVSNEIYDKAVLDSGIKDIEQEQELNKYYENLYKYETNEKDR